MYNQLTESIKGQVVNLIFKVSFIEQPRNIKTEEKRPDIIGDSSGHTHQSVINEPSHRDSEIKVGRNDPCPCGAKHPDGRPKKFKHCHGK